MLHLHKVSLVPFMLCTLLWQLTSAPASAATLSLTLTDQNKTAVEDAVIYVTTVNGKHVAPMPQTAIVDQIGEMFVPHVRAVTLGSRVSFPNSDPIRHMVYSFSGAKNFELPLYSGAPPAPVLFDKAGLVTLGCNIHDHMVGYILVLDTPYYAEVHEGKATITNLPAGQLAVEIWHPLLTQEQALQLTITVSADQNATLSQQLELRPERKVRRAPHRGATHY